MAINPLEIETSVLIVGAGPAGLVLALSLLQNDINVRIIEKTADLYIGQRGAGVMPRSLELYHLLGVLPDINSLGIRTPTIKICVAGTRDEEVLSVSDMYPSLEPTPAFPILNPILIGQGQAQRVLQDHMKKYGGEVECSTELKGFDQYDDYVVAHIVKTVDGEETKEDVKVGYLVGADGTKGIVRKILGLSFLGETRQDGRWVMADVLLKNPPIDTKYWHMWGNPKTGSVAIRPTENPTGNQFWVGITGLDLDFQSLATDKGAFADYVRKMSGLHTLEFEKYLTYSSYTINVRMVDKFSQGRVFIIGDAAHAHSFTGAQGMNSSIQDAFNLAWKLALVSKSLASPKLLESYSVERLPIIVGVLKKTSEVLTQVVAAETGKEISASWTRGREYYQLDVNYRGSAFVYDELISKDAERVTAGDRAPDAPGLVPLTEGAASRLFDIFSPTRHTAIILPTDKDDITAFTDALKKYPAGTVYTVAVLPKGSELAKELSISSWSVDVVLDSDGHCWGTYPITEGAKVVIVRPDGCVGAVAETASGVEKYRSLLFDVHT